MNIYQLCADAVLVLHFGFVLFVIFGGLLVLRYRRVIWLHLPAAAWGAFVEFGSIICPLTYVEDRLRELAGQEAQAGDFISRTILPVMYPAGLTREAQLVLGILVVSLNGAVYAWIV
ncbi:MAG: DUF2784 domain-containing protein, partial [Planctomycetota bacterium]|nr:DUF2784 domain-containing protein [Planctomycetota bacterium]